jgi:opacity protein-like surface antigen
MKHIFKTFLLWCLGGLITTGQAGTAGSVASSPTAFYVSAGIGGSFSNTHDSFTSNSNSVLYTPTAVGTSLFTLPNININNTFKSGFDLNAAIGGYINPHWRADLEFLYQNIRRDSYGTYDWLEQRADTLAIYAQQANNRISKASNRAHIYSFLTNLAYDFTPIQKWQPLISAGVGVAWLKAGSLQTNDILSIDDPNTPLLETAPAIQNSPSLYGTAFAYQFKAGMAYQVSDSTMAILQYRLYGTSQFKANPTTIITNPGTVGQTLFYTSSNDIKGLLINSIELNMRFNV